MENTIVKTFEACARTAKVADRKKLLMAANQDLITTILADCYDKTVTYGITTKNILIAFSGELTIDEDYSRFHEVLMKLASRALTGNAALDTVTDVIQMFTEADQAILLSIIDRTLAIGVTYESWTKMLGRKLVKFEVPLAYHLDKAPGKPNPIDGTYFASHKLDGVRLLSKVDLDAGKVTFYSRTGKEYNTLKNLELPLLKIFAGHTGVWAVDGECCHLLADGSEDFQGIMKEVTRKNFTIPDPHYCVFDAVPWAVFEEKEVGENFTERYKLLTSLPKDEHIIILEQERVDSQETYDKWLKRVVDNNWEGFMLRKDAPFRKGRTSDLLKVKPYTDDEFTVVDYAAGKQVFAVPGKGNMEFDGVKDIVIELPCGDRVNVGSGLTKEQRIEWLKDPSKIIGKTVTVKYLEETTDQYGKHSLRHPTLKYVYEGKREV